MAKGPPHGWRTVAMGGAVTGLALLPVLAALFAPDESAFPSGRLPALLAGATLLFAGIWIAAAGLGSSSGVPLAALLSAFTAVPLVLTLGDLALSRQALATPLVPLLQMLILGAVAAFSWADVLQSRARDGGGLSATLLGLALLAPLLALLTPLAAVTGAIAPLLGVAALAGARRGPLSPWLPRTAVALAALPLVVAPARAVVRMAMALLPLPGVRLRLPRSADPAMGEAFDLVAAGAALAAVALTAARDRLPEGELRRQPPLLRDRPHAAAAALLSAGLAAAAFLALRPELALWRPEARAVAALPLEARRALLRLGSSDPAWRAHAVAVLADVGVELRPDTPVADAIVRLLHAPDPGVRRSAATVLRIRGEVASKATVDRFVEALVLCLGSEERELRRLALVALPHAAPQDVGLLRAVLRAFPGEDAELRGAALGALAQCGPAGRELLSRALEEEDGLHDAALLRALSPQLTPPERLALLRRMLASPRPGRRALAAEGLREIARAEPAVAPELAALLATEDDVGVRQIAFLALAEHFPARVAATDPAILASLLDAPLWAVRTEARRALQIQGDPREVVIPALLVTLESGDTYAREEAIVHLARIGAPPDAAARIARCLAEDARQGLRVAASALLGGMGSAAAPAASALAEVAVGSDPHAAAHAQQALAAIGPAARDALPVLERGMKTMRLVPQGLVDAVARISEDPRSQGEAGPPPR